MEGNEHSDLALIVSCFDWYEGRVGAIRAMLIERSFRVKILMSSYDHVRKSYADDQYPDCERISVSPYQKNVSLARVRSHIQFASGVNRVLASEKPKLVYLLVPPNKTALYCQRYRESHPDTVFIIDVIDLWPESLLGNREIPLARAKWAGYRNDAIRRADHVFTECNLYQEKLTGVLDPSRVSTLYLYKNVEPPTTEPTAIETTPDHVEEPSLVLGYVGSINSIIDIDEIARIVSALVKEGSPVKARVIGDGEGRDAFLQSLEQAGCDVSYYGAIFDQKAKQSILANCDYALNIMKESVSVGLTIKSVDYLSMGIPIINNIAGDTWKMVEECGIGFNVRRNDAIGFDTSALDVNQPIMSRNAKQCFDDRFSREAFERSFLAGLDSCFQQTG